MTQSECEIEVDAQKVIDHYWELYGDDILEEQVQQILLERFGRRTKPRPEWMNTLGLPEVL